MCKCYFQLFLESPLLLANRSEHRDSAKRLKFGERSSWELSPKRGIYIIPYKGLGTFAKEWARNMLEQRDRRKGCKTPSSRHDMPHCNHELTGSVATDARSERDQHCWSRQERVR